MPKIVVSISSEQLHDTDDVPTHEDGKRAFYWGAWEDSPIPKVRLWVLFDQDVTPEVAFQMAHDELN